MILLSLDPSSTAVGYAIFDDATPREIGKLTPHKKSAEADARIDSLVPQLQSLLAEVKPDVCVIEQPLWAKPGRDVKTACLLHRVFGEVRRVCVQSGARVEYVYTSTWKANAAKASVIMEAKATLKGYGNDAGGDAADALALGKWWLARKAI